MTDQLRSFRSIRSFEPRDGKAYLEVDLEEVSSKTCAIKEHKVSSKLEFQQLPIDSKGRRRKDLDLPSTESSKGKM